ncbi:MAG TPA: hypothetical protein VF265_04090 [Nevskiaceae bacterium]
MTSLEESLSALVDGECTSEQLDAALAACRDRPELLSRYSRHWAAREAHCGRYVHPQAERLCAEVMRQIDAPRASKSARHRFITHSASRMPRRRWRMASSLALAASLGAIVVFTTYRAAAPVGGTVAGSSVATEVNATVAPPSADPFAVTDVGTRAVRWSRIDPQSAGVLDDYLVQRAPRYGVGRLSHATDGEYSGYYVPGMASEVRYSPVRQAPQ